MTSVDGTGAPRPASASVGRALRPDVAELLPDGLVIVGGDRRIHFANAEALRILDCDESDLVGRALSEGLPLPTSTAATGGRTPTRGTVWPAAPVTARSSSWRPKGQDVLVTARYVRGRR